ncbi:MAG: hypothetical protein ACFFDM_10495 [Candidatus Thorarchaeota archaeon]
MGCQVLLSTEQPYFRTDKVKFVTGLHTARAIIFITLSFVVEDVFMILLGIGFVELMVAWWFWNLKLESWGVSLGLCAFHFLFPAVLGISLLAMILLLGFSLVQIGVLGLIRSEGGFSFNHIAQLDQAEMREANSTQKRMYQLAVIGQGLKTLSLIISGSTVTLYAAGYAELIPWTSLIQIGPVMILLTLLDGLATVGLYLGLDWGFHLTLMMVPVSFIETFLSLNPFAFLMAIWVLTIFMPCIAKDGFYSKLFQRSRARFGTYPISNQ